MLTDDSDDLSYNPFAEPEDDFSPSGGGSNLAQGYYSSAFFPKVPHSRPTLRRRRSSSTDYRPLKGNGDIRKHSRTLTEIQVEVPYSAGLHPLKSALARVDDSSLEDLGITRPHLSRLVSERNLEDVPSEDRTKSQPSPEEEKDVIIHQVSPKDSLPGIALKYGISLPNLRRANKLWPSDPIHHRAVLYIPVDQASRAREYIPELNLIDLHADTWDETSSIISSATSASASPLKREYSESVPSPTGAVRRIPTKQLSYFPPSSHKSIDPPLSDTNSPRISSGPASKALPNRYTSSPASNSLTSILTALPIAASTRDEILTRLSFDSVSSSFSDRSRINSDEDDGHELNEVKRPNPISVDESDNEEIDELSQPTPKASQRITPALLSQHDFSSSSLSKTTPSRPHPSTSSAHFYVSPAHETYVRTSQLEPSPSMKLPAFSSRTVGRSSGKPLQASSQMERVNSLTLGRKSKLQTPDETMLTLDNFTTNAPR